jgi:KUP system potassium uptake protein
MTTWHSGRSLITRRRVELEGSLQDFVDRLHAEGIPRVPGTAVFPHPTKETTPLALRANVAFNGVLHEHNVIISVMSENVPHVPHDERLAVDELGWAHDGITHLSARFGFQDDQDIPSVLRQARSMSPELDIDPDTAFYYLSRMQITRGGQPGLASWRKRLFIGLANNAASPAAIFNLPVDRTVVMGSQVQL